ncbi:CDP-glucose 4,6-dehydratase [Pseudobacter ginsenosidimutans]|uniref:CDP-glucose 4,6-dehydratase n=2 Tax=Pseudobacter ginsenosidimutans TaxID=661488 RepID=A0A4Q7N2U0_9BACT|nr:CDP-glucose 4,6-dehydratase [Pseudobacter ginsenosidimutans]RZS75284.1 CDP-glucose 4,6-dehydratase [Pseudobacter ginsenosidimutans]
MENLVSNASLQSAYKGKKVLLTGHTGFKGAWLMNWLQMLGADVKGYALPPSYEGGIYQLMEPFATGASILADIRNKELLKQTVQDFQPDFIFHLAAQPLVRLSYEIPAETFEVNAVGTANLLETAISLNKRCAVVVITTDKVYENKEQDILYTENDVLGGYDPYSASKACTEIVVSSFRSSFFNPSQSLQNRPSVASARAGNVIGGGDWSKDRIVPDIVRALRNGAPIPVRNPNSVRPWQHVLEPLHGYLILGAMLYAQPVEFSTAFNFGPLPADHLTVQELVETAIDSWGSGEWNNLATPGQPHEANLLKLHIGKAMQQLQWKPKLNAKEAIQWTIEWYKQPVEKQLDFTLNQINSYQQL